MSSDHIYDWEDTGVQNWGHTLDWTFKEHRKAGEKWGDPC